MDEEEQESRAVAVGSYNAHDGLRVHIKPHGGSPIPEVVAWSILKQLTEERLAELTKDQNLRLVIQDMGQFKGQSYKPAFPDPPNQNWPTG